MISLPLAPKVIEKKGNQAIFEIEALYPGYGVTIGNALRRVILSSLPGAAITQIKIKGVQHEFSTIPGVMEDIVMLILNLKQMRFKVFADEPQIVTLKVKGEVEAKGSDFASSSTCEVASPNVHIATLTDKKADLEIEAQVEKGMGFLPVEARKAGKLEIGQLPIDAIFTPIRKVSIHVENMRVGERTDFDKLTLVIETDGTISPEKALADSIDILIKQFGFLGENFEAKEEMPKIAKAEKKAEEAEEDTLKTKLEDLKISTRTLNALTEAGITTVGKIIKKTESGLLEVEGMGGKGIDEIKKALKKLKIGLKEEK